MALSTASSAARLPIFRAIAQAFGASSGRAMSAATTNTTTSDGQPTYYYAPPGSSMREPLYFSTSDPVYYVDPKPDTLNAAPLHRQPNTNAEEKAALRRPSPSPASGTTNTTSSSGAPTYCYMSPGSSMREPLYFSMSDPVYFVDPKPDEPLASAPAQQRQQQQPSSSGSSSKRPSPPSFSTPGPSTLKKVDLSHILGNRHAKPEPPVSYKMVDDMAQVPYVMSPHTHSMREPKYVSVSEPRYPVATSAAPKDK